MIIDIHTHTFPDRMADATVEHLSRVSHTIPFTHGKNSELTESMRQAGIDCSVVLPVATSARQVEKLNDYSARMNEHTEETGILYFGAMHPECEEYREELARAVSLGLKGIKIHPVYQGADVDSLPFLRIIDRAAELGLVVLTHGGLDIGFPDEVRCSPEMCRNVVDKVGKFKFIAAHMGGWRNWDQVPACYEGTGIMIDTSFSMGRLAPLDDGYYKTEEELQLMTPEEFVSLVRAVGAENVLFGTDCPWSGQKESMDAFRDLPLTEEEKTAILGGNAARLLGL